MRTLMILGLVVACAACSEGTNINQLFVSNDQKGAVDYLLERGQHHFDKKEFDKALGYADKAYALNHGNEASAVLLAYTHLAIAGVDVFSLSENLIDQSSAPAETSGGTTSAVSSLSSLGEVIGVTEGDTEEMKAEDNERTVGDRTINGVSTNPLFEDIPLDLPRTAVDARDNATLLLAHLGRAIEVICPFVNEEVKILADDTSTVEDPRHTLDACPFVDAPKRNGAKAHFLWALAHLTEGVAFNTFFAALNEKIILRAGAIENKTGQTIPVDQYVSGLTEIADTINIVMPTDPDEAQESMLRAIFNDLDAAAAAFGQMAGMPESLTKSITGALTDLRAKSSKLDEAAGDKDSAALKGQLLEKATVKIRDEMTKREATMSAQQKDDACAAYNSISTDDFDMCPRT